METLIEWVAIFVAGIVQYCRSQGVQVTAQDLVTRAEKHLDENSEALAEIAKRHIARFTGEP